MKHKITTNLLRKVASLIDENDYEVLDKVANETQSPFEKSDLAKLVDFLMSGSDDEV